MFRKLAIIGLVFLVVLTAVSIASAALSVANTSKKGSLLVFPKIEVLQGGIGGGLVGDGGALVDTYLFIGNDSPQPIWVKCYWMDENQSTQDFHFLLTANQPVVFSAHEGAAGICPPFSENAVGSLVCWAQDANDQTPVKFDHLYGYAMTQQIGGTYVFYNAYSFMLQGSPPPYVEGSDTSTLLLDGSMYDTCPKYLVTNFIPWSDRVTAPGFDGPLGYFWPNFRPDLTLWPCKQDLRQDRIPTCTKAKFDVWNESEVKFTGAYQCFKCFFEGFLDQIGDKQGYLYSRGPGFGGDKFIAGTLKTDTARLRVQGISSTICDGKTKGCVDNAGAVVRSVNTPLLGVMLYGRFAILGGDNGFDGLNYVLPVTGHNLTGAGSDGSGFIKWNPASTVVTKKQR